MNFAILGSGFGLYGYLPALVSCGQRIILPERYRHRLETRSELASYVSNVEWEIDEHAALKQATGVVLALQPSSQQTWIPDCLMHSHIDYLLLEKPLASSPQSSAILFDKLIDSGKTFRIGYSFRYTNWGKKLLAALSCPNHVNELSIRWLFEAHHFHQNIETWKRSHVVGGGIIRFYGIQLIALLAEIGYRNVTLSRITGCSADECETWLAIFIGEGLPTCEIFIDSRSSVNQFQIMQNTDAKKKFGAAVPDHLRDPFDSDQAGSPASLDRRIPILNQLCHSLWKPDIATYAWYAAVIKLWLVVEDKTQFKKIAFRKISA